MANQKIKKALSRDIIVFLCELVGENPELVIGLTITLQRNDVAIITVERLIDLDLFKSVAAQEAPQG